MKNNKIIFLFCIAAFTASSVAFIHHQLNSPIVGTWISVDDLKSKWVFTNDSKLKTYYEGEPYDTYTYHISGTSPQCGVSVESELQLHPDLRFLELTSLDDNEKSCYYIYSLNEGTLTLSPFGRGGLQIFKRKEFLS